MGRLKFEALREEEHRFDENDHTATSAVRQRLCCSAAMHASQQSVEHVGIPAPGFIGGSAAPICSAWNAKEKYARAN